MIPLRSRYRPRWDRNGGLGEADRVRYHPQLAVEGPRLDESTDTFNQGQSADLTVTLSDGRSKSITAPSTARLPARVLTASTRMAGIAYGPAVRLASWPALVALGAVVAVGRQALLIGVVALLAVLAMGPPLPGAIFVGALAAYTFGRQLLFPLRNDSHTRGRSCRDDGASRPGQWSGRPKRLARPLNKRGSGRRVHSVEEVRCCLDVYGAGQPVGE